jgi:hypothetical protein
MKTVSEVVLWKTLSNLDGQWTQVHVE